MWFWNRAAAEKWRKTGEARVVERAQTRSEALAPHISPCVSQVAWGRSLKASGPLVPRVAGLKGLVPWLL